MSGEPLRTPPCKIVAFTTYDSDLISLLVAIKLSNVAKIDSNMLVHTKLLQEKLPKSSYG